MPLSAGYIAREAGSNLWRNRLMTIAAVLTVAVSLSLVGGAMVLRQGVANATASWQHGVNIIVWFEPSASAGNETATTHSLLALPTVLSCTFRNQAYDFREASKVLPPSESQVLTVASTPASTRCVLKNPNFAASIAKEFTNRPGILSVLYPSQAIHTMENVTHVLQWAFFGVALILLVSASVLIVNTIRLAIFARRREVSVMKLVGATNWFIRVPFMCEGLAQGVMGAVVAALVVIGLESSLNALAGSDTSGLLYQMRMTGLELFVTVAFVLIVGVIVGTLGSALAIRRFLEA
jgi:cell division transport system permease protein